MTQGPPSSRLLYSFGTDKSAGTYVTNYLVSGAVLICAVVSFVATRRKREASGAAVAAKVHWIDRFTFTVLSWGFLISYAVSYFFAGLAHHVAYWETCPGRFVNETASTAATTVFYTKKCPPGGKALYTGIWATAMFFQGFAVCQYIPISALLCSCARVHG